MPAAAAVAAGAAVAVALWPAPSTSPPVTRFALSVSADNTLLLDPQSRDLAITPDGTRVIYKGGTRRDRTQLFLHELDQLDAKPLTGIGMPKGPFTSPDGRWVGFFEPGGSGAVLKTSGDRRRPGAGGLTPRWPEPRQHLGRGQHHHRGVRRASHWPSPHPARRRCARRADTPQPGTRRERSLVAAVPARRQVGPLHHHCAHGPRRRRAGGGARRCIRHVEDAHSRRESGAVRAERSSGVRVRRRRVGGRVRPDASGDDWNGSRGHPAGRDTSDRASPSSTSPATARSHTWPAAARARSRARWCGSIGKVEKSRFRLRPGSTPMCGCRRMGRAWRWRSKTRTRTSGSGTSRARRSRGSRPTRGWTKHRSGCRTDAGSCSLLRPVAYWVRSSGRQPTAVVRPNPCTRARSFSGRPTFCRTAQGYCLPKAPI